MKWSRPLPAVGARVHYDTGHAASSWSATVRGIVDREWLVLRRWSRGKQAWVYWIEWRWMWEQGHVQPGSLRKRTAKKGGEG